MTDVVIFKVIVFNPLVGYFKPHLKNALENAWNCWQSCLLSY